MSISRRKFILRSAIASPMIYNFHQQLDLLKSQLGEEINWDVVRAQFPIINWDKIHFNSGSAGVMPIMVQEYLTSLIAYMNARAPYEAWNDWQKIKKENIYRLSSMINAPEGSIEIVRNTTEALNMIIYGLKVDKGDEVIISSNDYPFAINAWKNRQERDEIEIKKLDITLPLEDEEVIKIYEQNISPKTKVIHITHITHREGHIMPIQKICEIAHARGIQVVVDGAHSFGLMKFDIQELSADYYATSLHKWLNAPHGTGLIFVQPQHIGQLYNHPSSYLKASDSISKFEHIGTRAFHQEIGISAALDFYDSIPYTAKVKRLQELKEYWIGSLQNNSKVNFHTFVEPRYSAAIATFSIEGYSGGQLVKILDRDYDIHIKSVSGPWGSGLRMSVNLFTSISELDTLVRAIKTITA